MNREVSALIGKENYSFSELCRIVSILRAPDGCPWDREQTHESLRRYLLEETYEVAEAIDRRDPLLLREELGDLLLQILFHADIEEGQGHFGIDGVISDEARKMIERHPHVFGAAEAERTIASWEESKNQSKGRRTLYDKLQSIPACLPALLRAQKMKEKGVSYPKNQALLQLLEKEASMQAKDPKTQLTDFFLTAIDFFAERGVNCEEALAISLSEICENTKNESSR